MNSNEPVNATNNANRGDDSAQPKPNIRAPQKEAADYKICNPENCGSHDVVLYSVNCKLRDMGKPGKKHQQRGNFS